jgi:hypothetical protein
MIKNGAIGTLREIHNWSMRPMWPQFPTPPADSPPVPAGFDWKLWLGPSLDRPYHPNYTHTNFRGWYEFGGGSIADMGHYSLWPLFQLLDLESPISVESTPSHVCRISDEICQRIKNDYSFPAACTIRMRFAPKGERAALDIFWYDGGIKPPVPEELMAENQEFEEEGMLFVGDKGKILGGFHSEDPQLIPQARMRAYRKANNLPEPAPRQRRGGGGRGGDVWGFGDLACRQLYAGGDGWEFDFGDIEQFYAQSWGGEQAELHDGSGERGGGGFEQRGGGGGGSIRQYRDEQHVERDDCNQWDGGDAAGDVERQCGRRRGDVQRPSDPSGGQLFSERDQ